MFPIIRFSLFAIVLQLIFIILFGVFVRYPELGVPKNNASVSDSERHGALSTLELGSSYPCKSSAAECIDKQRR